MFEDNQYNLKCKNLENLVNKQKKILEDKFKPKKQEEKTKMYDFLLEYKSHIRNTYCYHCKPRNKCMGTTIK